MSDKESSPFGNPFHWLFRTSLLILGAMLALTYSLELLQSMLPWLIGIALLVGAVWVIVAVIRWRRSQW